MEAVECLLRQRTNVGTEGNFARNDRDCRSRGSVNDADRENQVVSGFEPLIPQAVHTIGQFGKSEHGVVSELFVNGAGMSGLADAANRLMTKVAADAGDDTDAVFFGRIKGRALFDMKFDKGSHLGEIDNRLAGCQIFRIKAAFFDGLSKCFSVAAMFEG